MFLFGQIMDRVVRPERHCQDLFVRCGIGNSGGSDNKPTTKKTKKITNTTKTTDIPELVWFTSFHWQHTRPISKLHFLRMVWEHPLLMQHPETREALLDSFCRMQRVYWGFARLAQHVRTRKARVVVDCDMQLNPIVPDNRWTISIWHERHVYLFNMRELLRHINVLLANSYMFYSEPLNVKNPYNNVPFPKSVLYHLFLVLTERELWGRASHRFEDDLFIKFCRCEFDLRWFLQEHEPMLRDRAIANHMSTSPAYVLLNDVRSMLGEYNETQKRRRDRIFVDPDFPGARLLALMRPYLLLKYRACFSMTSVIKSRCRDELHQRLRRFQKHNPDFGSMRLRFRYTLVDRPPKFAAVASASAAEEEGKSEEEKQKEKAAEQENQKKPLFRLTSEKLFDEEVVPWYKFDRRTFLHSHLNEPPPEEDALELQMLQFQEAVRRLSAISVPTVSEIDGWDSSAEEEAGEEPEEGLDSEPEEEKEEQEEEPDPQQASESKVADSEDDDEEAHSSG